MQVYYHTNVDNIKEFCRAVDRGIKIKKQGYGENSELTKSQFYSTQPICKGLGFVRENGKWALELTPDRGRKVLGNEQEVQQAFQEGVQEDEFYQELLSRIEPHTDWEGFVDNEVIEDAIRDIIQEEELIDKRIDSKRDINPAIVEGARILFRKIIEIAGMGRMHKRGQEKILQLKDSQTTVQKTIHEVDPETEKNIDVVIEGEESELIFEVKKNERELRIPKESIDEAFSSLERFENTDNKKLKFSLER